MVKPIRRVEAARIAVALDVPTLDEAAHLAALLEGHVGVFKVGLELFGAYGPEAVQRIGSHGPVFLDLKLHDIPNTVKRAAARLAALDVSYITIHASGGPSMVEAAVEGFGDAGTVLAVTLLTSMGSRDTAAIGMPPPKETVPRLAVMATRAGAHGLVCAAPDLHDVSEVVPGGTVLVTPGIRPAGASTDDQTRVATPGEAIADGADLIVVGRPITGADDPVAAADAIANEPIAP